MSDKHCPKSEFSEKFIEQMKDRMNMSYYKYGLIKEAYPHKINAVKSALKRIEKYIETGNGEMLVDAANFLMIESILPAHENYHFVSIPGDGGPGRIWWHGPSNHKRNDQ